LTGKAANQNVKLIWKRIHCFPDVALNDMVPDIASIGSARGFVDVVGPNNFEGVRFIFAASDAKIALES
jgi:hypothetical protein